jgi:TATA-binding protein-associated factor
VNDLDLKILPYLIFFLAPVLARMTDPDTPVRLIATQTFATLVKLIPLEAGAPSPPGFSPETLAKRDEQRFFVRQLIDGSKAEQYAIPVKVAVNLRSYQKEGVSWLAFLVKFKLHGILCDGALELD